jgi:hypothetical protein
MIKRDIEAYRIYVKENDKSAVLLCSTYKIGLSGNDYISEFIVIQSNFEHFPLPEHFNPLTFREELRIYSSVFTIIPAGIENIETWIQQKLKEAYGDDCKIKIDNLKS